MSRIHRSIHARDTTAATVGTAWRRWRHRPFEMESFHFLDRARRDSGFHPGGDVSKATVGDQNPSPRADHLGARSTSPLSITGYGHAGRGCAPRPVRLRDRGLDAARASTDDLHSYPITPKELGRRLPARSPCLVWIRARASDGDPARPARGHQSRSATSSAQGFILCDHADLHAGGVLTGRPRSVPRASLLRGHDAAMFR